jgi:hypothetical protein
MVKNFVSISAVTNREQLSGIYKIYQEEKFSFPLAIGYQFSNKSINQGAQNNRQPELSEFRDLYTKTLEYRFLPAVHYYTKDQSTIIPDLDRLIKIGVTPNATLVQFNTLPPSPEILQEVKKMNFKTIFKVAVANKNSPEEGYAVWKGAAVQDVSTGEVTPLISQIKRCSDFIDYAMFDPSHGTNLDLNLDENSLAIKFGKAITSNHSLNHLGLVYAGGIKPSNVSSLVRTVNSFFPNRVSIDTESGVRTNDSLDLDLVRQYLTGYASALSTE